MKKSKIIDEIIEERFKSGLLNYQKNLEEPMRGSEFVSDSIDLFYYHLQKVDLKMSASYIDSPEWFQNKKGTINPQKNDDNYFQYVLTVSLNHQNIADSPQIISKVKAYIDQYNWKEIDFSSRTKDRKNWKNFEQNNKAIAFNILFLPHNTKQIRPACISKQKFKCENQVVLLMITDGTKWHYLAVKNFSALFRRITSNHNGDFYCLDCFYSYSTKEKLKKHEKVSNNYDYCYVAMLNENNKILKYKHGEKSMRVPFAIYAGLECLLE